MMTIEELAKEIDVIYDGLTDDSSEEEMDRANEKVGELLRSECNIIKVHAPTLDESMRAKMQLFEGKCPNGKDGQCSSCNLFVGYKNESGVIFSYMVFEGYCAKEG